MENKINISELLKDCPKGTKLYSPLVGECTLEHIHGELKKILISTSDGTTLTFNYNGTYFQMDNSECLLFPSKDQRDWSKFQRPFKDGDILISGLEDNPFIFKRINGLGNAQCYCAISCFGQLILNNDNWTCIKGCRLATEEEKARLFQAIKDNGYKWNEETKTLKELIEPKFKVGDRIQSKNFIEERTIKICEEDGYWTTVDSWIRISDQDNWELVPNKFDITTLKPFESRVLVRNHNHHYWRISFFGFFDKNKCVYDTIRGIYSQCIPYEGNEHLCGTTNDCNEYYKTWV